MAGNSRALAIEMIVAAEEAPKWVKMLKFVSKTRNFVLNVMNLAALRRCRIRCLTWVNNDAFRTENEGFCIKNEKSCIKNEEFCIQNDELCIENEKLCIKDDELCIKNEEFCIKDDELCIKNEEFCIKNDELCRSCPGRRTPTVRTSSCGSCPCPRCWRTGWLRSSGRICCRAGPRWWACRRRPAKWVKNENL